MDPWNQHLWSRHWMAGPVVLGGVFNCTLNPHLDRSYKTTTGRHDSPALRRLLARVQMRDVLEDELRRIEDE
uniref:Uncharacterized protein n=1 Tax=Hyaloperonospora arabidopsidis (strain Emoy2) TaxID=559515 RepID=M4BQ98_HYAAE